MTSKVLCVCIYNGWMGMFHRWNTSKSRWELLNLVFSSRWELLNLGRETFLVWSLKTSVGWVGITRFVGYHSSIKLRTLKCIKFNDILIDIRSLSSLLRALENWILSMPFQNDESLVWPYLGSAGSINIPKKKFKICHNCVQYEGVIKIFYFHILNITKFG